MLEFRCLQDDILNNFCVMYLYLMIEVIYYINHTVLVQHQGIQGVINVKGYQIEEDV